MFGKSKTNIKNFNRINQRLDNTYKQLEQTGKRVSVPRDRARIALPPGKRISRNGKPYWETRANRTDKLGSTL